MKAVQKIPLPISGVALAVASLGNLLLPHGDILYVVCGILSAFLLSLFIVRIVFDTKNVKEDLKNPVMLSVFPTSTMATMLLLVYIEPFIGAIAVFLWYAALLCHVSIMILFFKRFIIKPKLENVFPTWFVACVGIIVASVTSPAMGAVALGQVIFIAGFITYMIILPIVIYRRIKLPKAPEPTLPTVAIFTAPMNLSVVGYLSVFDQPVMPFLYTMLIASFILYIYATIKVFILVFITRLKFYPSFAALTFPYVITATAYSRANELLLSEGYNFCAVVADISKWLAVVVVIYVLIRYAIYFATINRTSK